MKLFYRKVVIAQHQRGLVLKDKQVVRLLEPGVHKWFAFGESVDVIEARAAKVTNAQVLNMIDSHGDVVNEIISKH